MIVICPTRGRVEEAKELLDSFRKTASLPTTRLIFVVDSDDPLLYDYIDRLRVPRDDRKFGWDPDNPWLIVLAPEQTGNLVKATNSVSLRAFLNNEIIGNVGDDHRFRTGSWDKLVTSFLKSPGIAYGNDLYQGDNLPTAPFISKEIVFALGWYALPTCNHMYIDNAWKLLGQKLNCLYYIPFILEHMHPVAGKSNWDAGYTRANETFEHDQKAFDYWVKNDLDKDVERVKEALKHVST